MRNELSAAAVGASVPRLVIRNNTNFTGTIMKYSVVIPLKDEEGNIEDLVEELEPVMNSLLAPWELICVDDGSRDRTPTILSELASRKPYLKVITFARNYGQSSGFAAGFGQAAGEVVITMDGDRQNDPLDIPKLLASLVDADMVCGQRRQRQDSPYRRFVSKLGNIVRRWACQDDIQDNNCSLKAYRTQSLVKIKMFEGMHRFLPALFHMEGLRVKEIPVNHRERASGKSKYSILTNRSINTIIDLLAVVWMRKRTLRFEVRNE